MDGFRIDIISPSFQMLGMVLCWIDRFNMSVRGPMATGPKCFRCLYEMSSGPTENVGFVCYIASLSYWGLKEVGECFVGAACAVFCLFSCLRCSVVVRRWMSSVG